MNAFESYIAGWNVGYWNGRNDQLDGSPYQKRTTDFQWEMSLVDGALVLPNESPSGQ